MYSTLNEVRRQDLIEKTKKIVYINIEGKELPQFIWGKVPK